MLVSYSASAAAIFIGWTSVITLASRSPVTRVATAPISMPTRPSRTDLRNSGTSRCFIRK